MAMARTMTPFRYLILFLRGTTTSFGIAALVLSSTVLNIVIQNDEPWEAGYTALPLAAAIAMIIWNTVSFILMLRKQIPQLFLIWGDASVVLVALALGITGIAHDITAYSGGDSAIWGYWAPASSMVVCVVGIVVLMIAVAGQMFLVLFNILEHRHVKEAGKRVALAQYGGCPGAVVERGDFGHDWKSATSDELTEDSLIYEGSSEISRPALAVEPKSRYNPLLQRGSNEV